MFLDNLGADLDLAWSLWHAMNPGDKGAMRDSDLSSARSAGQQEEYRIVMVSWW